MSTNTNRHTARPSRARRALARVALAHDRADAYLDRHLVAVFGGIGGATMAGTLALAVFANHGDTLTAQVFAFAPLALMLAVGALLASVALCESAERPHRETVARYRREISRLTADALTVSRTLDTTRDALIESRRESQEHRADAATNGRALIDARWSLDNMTDERDALAYVVMVLIDVDADRRDAMRARVVTPFIAVENDDRDPIAVLGESAVVIRATDERARLARVSSGVVWHNDNR